MLIKALAGNRAAVAPADQDIQVTAVDPHRAEQHHAVAAVRLIADEVDAQAKHRADLSTYREVGTLGYRHRKLTRIVDTLHFAPSNASRLVQAADVIAFLYRRVFTCEETDERSRRAKLAMWKRLVPRVQHELCWFPSTEAVAR